MNDIEQSTHREDFQIDWIESQDLGLDSDEDCEENVKMIDVSTKQLPKNKSKEKQDERPGKWSDSLVNDLVAIIANEEYYKK